MENSELKNIITKTKNTNLIADYTQRAAEN